MTIDVHAHILERGLLDMLASGANDVLNVERMGDGFRIPGYGEADRLLYDLDGRLASLEARGIDLQLVAPPPPMWSRPGWVPGLSEVRMMNAATRRAVERSRGRLAGLIVLPLREPGAIVAEIERELDAGGFVGVALPTSAGGLPLDGDAFEPMFAHLSAQAIVAFMHSVTRTRQESLGEFSLNTVIGWPTETAVTVARLVFSGILERFPQRLILSHGGGVLPWLAGRIDLAYGAPHYERNEECRRRIQRHPSTYLREIFFDTVVASPASLSFLIDFAGHANVLFGSDFPYEIGDAEGRLAAPALDALPASRRAAILHGNAARLLGDRLPRSSPGGAASLPPPATHAPLN